MEKYLIDDEECNEEEFNNRLEEDNEAECEYNYDDMLDDCYEQFQIGRMLYPASQTLKAVDKIAYLCGLSDYADSRLQDLKYDLDRGHEVEVNGYTFKKEVVNEHE